MSDRRAAARYAEALLEVAREAGAIEPVRGELDALAAIVGATPELYDFVARPDLEVEQKERALTAALGGRVSPLVLSTLRVLLHHQRGQELPEVAAVYNELADAAEGILRAEARTAIPLTEEQRARLTAALQRLTGKQVVLQEIVDPSVLAGVAVHIGDYLIDGSAAGRLARMREELLGVGSRSQ